MILLKTCDFGNSNISKYRKQYLIWNKTIRHFSTNCEGNQWYIIGKERTFLCNLETFKIIKWYIFHEYAVCYKARFSCICINLHNQINMKRCFMCVAISLTTREHNKWINVPNKNFSLSFIAWGKHAIIKILCTILCILFLCIFYIYCTALPLTFSGL